MNEPNSIRIAAIIGSVRPDNYTAKAVALVEDEFARRHPRSLPMSWILAI